MTASLTWLSDSSLFCNEECYLQDKQNHVRAG